MRIAFDDTGPLRYDGEATEGKGGSPMLRKLALASLASFILLTPALVTAQIAGFRIEEATIEDIRARSCVAS